MTRPETFSSRVHELLREFGWYSSYGGYRESSDHDRGTRPALSEGQVVDAT